MKVATLAELRDTLTALCEKYPEIADKPVMVSSESGYSGAGIAWPVILYEYNIDNNHVHIYTDDDIFIKNNDKINIYKEEI